MNSLGLVAITPPDKTITSENGGHNSSNFSASVTLAFLVTLFLIDKVFRSYIVLMIIIGEVYDISHSLTNLEK